MEKEKSAIEKEKAVIEKQKLTIEKQKLTIEKEKSAIEDQMQNKAELNPYNISLLLRGDTVAASKVKKTKKGHQGIKKIVKWMVDSMQHISDLAHEMTYRKFSSTTLLQYAAYSLKISPQKMSTVGSTATTSERSAKDLSIFLGLPQCQASRVPRKVSSDNQEKIKRVVIWISNVIKHIAQMVEIASPSSVTKPSKTPAWIGLLGLATHKLGITPIPNKVGFFVEQSDTSLDLTSVNAEQLVRTLLSRYVLTLTLNPKP